MCPAMRAYWHHLANTVELVHIGAIWQIWLNFCLLWPPEYTTQTASRSVQLFSHSSRQKVPILTMGAPFPQIAPSYGDLDPHLIHDSLGQSKPTNQMASRSVQPFWTDDRRAFLYFTMVRPPPQNCPFPLGIWTPSYTWFLGPPKSSTHTASRLVQLYLQGSLVWHTDRHTTLLGR